MALDLALFNALWSFRNAAFTGHPAPAVIAPIAFSAPFQAVPKVDVQLASFSLVPPNVPIDGLMADLQDTIEFEAAGDLFRAPLALDVALNQHPVRRGKLLISARNGPPGCSTRNGLAGAVSTVIAGVSPNLPPNAGSVAAQVVSNLGNGKLLFSQGGNDYPLFRGDLAIVHCDVPNLAGKGASHYPRSPRFRAGALQLVYESKCHNNGFNRTRGKLRAGFAGLVPWPRRLTQTL